MWFQAMCEGRPVKIKTYSVAYFLFFKVRRLCFNFSIVSFGNPFSFNFLLRSLILSEESSSSVTIALQTFSSMGSSSIASLSSTLGTDCCCNFSLGKTCSSKRSNESKSWLNASKGLNRPKSE